jgi:hypothetical protein
MLNRGILATSASGWSILIRLLVGLIVFFPEGGVVQNLPFLGNRGRAEAAGLRGPDGGFRLDWQPAWGGC